MFMRVYEQSNPEYTVLRK